jgi:hypothetical protein
MERCGLRWLPARELVADGDRWAVRMRDERGYRKQLPDLAVWQRGAERPVAIVGDEGHRREDRQRMILAGWRDAIWAEQYAAVQYDCVSAAAAAKIRRIAKRAQLGPPSFIAAAQRTADEIRSIGPDPAVDERALESDATVNAGGVAVDQRSDERQSQLVRPEVPTASIQEMPPPPPERMEWEDAAERYREIFGLPEPKPRRRWRR